MRSCDLDIESQSQSQGHSKVTVQYFAKEMHRTTAIALNVEDFINSATPCSEFFLGTFKRAPIRLHGGDFGLNFSTL